MHENKAKTFRPKWKDILSDGWVRSERLNSKQLPFSFVPTSTLVVLSGVVFVAFLTFFVPSEKLVSKATNFFAPAGHLIASSVDPSDTDNSTRANDATKKVFGLSPSTQAIEQPTELASDVTQALTALGSGNNSPFTEFPADGISFEAGKFSLKRVTDSTAFMAIPVAHFRTYKDNASQPPTTKYRLINGTFADAPTPTAERAGRDTMFFAALRKEGSQWVAYNFKPARASFQHEKIKAPDVTQEMIQQTFNAAFGNSK